MARHRRRVRTAAGPHVVVSETRWCVRLRLGSEAAYLTGQQVRSLIAKLERTHAARDARTDHGARGPEEEQTGCQSERLS